MSKERLSLLQRQILDILHENDYYVYATGTLFNLIVNKFHHENLLTLNKAALRVSLSRSLRNLESKGYVWLGFDYCGRCRSVSLIIVDDSVLGGKTFES